jgi:ubiquitin-like-conjugating enzyme ATG10
MYIIYNHEILTPQQSQSSQTFLEIRHQTSHPTPKKLWFQKLDVEEEDDVFEDDDPESLLPSQICRSIEIIYNVLYNPTYRLPVLYFLPSFPLSAEELLLLLSPEGVGGFTTGTISQGDHLLSGDVWWFVHPCKTGEAMAEWENIVGKDSGHYIGIWLGLVGGIVGLN